MFFSTRQIFASDQKLKAFLVGEYYATEVTSRNNPQVGTVSIRQGDQGKLILDIEGVSFDNGKPLPTFPNVKVRSQSIEFTSDEIDKYITYRGVLPNGKSWKWTTKGTGHHKIEFRINGLELNMRIKRLEPRWYKEVDVREVNGKIYGPYNAVWFQDYNSRFILERK